jgi:hypothetical protein
MLRYCRAYPAEQLRRFHPLSRWLDEIGASGTDDVLYLWQDMRVTVDPLSDEQAFAADTKEWAAFCETEMGFTIPPDIAAVPDVAVEPETAAPPGPAAPSGAAAGPGVT